MQHAADMDDYTLLGLTKPFAGVPEHTKTPSPRGPGALEHKERQSAALRQSRNRSSRMMIGIGMPIIKSTIPRTMVISSTRDE
jgi:hypothetical protein